MRGARLAQRARPGQARAVSDEDDELREAAREMRGTRPGAALRVALLVLAQVAVIVVGFVLTSPWPLRGPGGGRDTNLWGPMVTFSAAVLVGLVLRRWLSGRSR